MEKISKKRRRKYQQKTKNKAKTASEQQQQQQQQRTMYLVYVCMLKHWCHSRTPKCTREATCCSTVRCGLLVSELIRCVKRILSGCFYPVSRSPSLILYSVCHLHSVFAVTVHVPSI